MENVYAEAATAIAEYLNGYGFGIDRSLPLKDQVWWNELSGASYNLLTEHFKKKHIQITLDPVYFDWLTRRAFLRGSSIKNMSHQDILIYDLVDILGYYNDETVDNPPMEYIFPESFWL